MLQQVCLAAINKYGHKPQWRQVQEECNELAVAVSHYVRQRKGAKEEVIDELADVYICLRQALLMLQCWDEFYECIDFKINRLNEKIKGSLV